MLDDPVVIVNDGKGKHQSYEAHVQIGALSHPDGWIGPVAVAGYGPDESTARASLREILEGLRNQLSEILSLPTGRSDA